MLQLTTDRLCLRDFVPDDVDAVLQDPTDPRYLEHYHRGPYSREECVESVEDAIAEASKDPRTKYNLAITSREGRTLLGGCGVRCESGGDSRGDIGYELAPVHWGQGYATEAVAAILQVGFETLDLDEIEARVVVENARSARVLERLSFTEIERLPPGPGRGRFKDHRFPERAVYLLTRSDWRKRVTSGLEGTGAS